MRRRLRKRFIPILCLPFVAAGVLIFNSLKPKETKVIIWTDQNCFASYAELFNTTQNDYQVIIKYKENLAEDFPADSGGQPDIVIGPWLKNEKARKSISNVLNSIVVHSLLLNPSIVSRLNNDLLSIILQRFYLRTFSFENNYLHYLLEFLQILKKLKERKPFLISKHTVYLNFPA